MGVTVLRQLFLRLAVPVTTKVQTLVVNEQTLTGLFLVAEARVRGLEGVEERFAAYSRHIRLTH